MTNVKLNFNDRVFCTLSPEGEQIAIASGCLTAQEISRIPTGGIQLWCLLEALGCQLMHNGSPPAVVNSTIEWRGGVHDPSTPTEKLDRVRELLYEAESLVSQCYPSDAPNEFSLALVAVGVNITKARKLIIDAQVAVR